MNGRVRRLVDSYEDRWPHVALALLILALLSFSIGGILYLNPPTETVTTGTASKHAQLTIETSATLTENTKIYDKGDVLRNAPLYVLDTMPQANLHVTTTLPVNTTNSTITTNAYLVLTATNQDVTVWQERYSLITDQQAYNTGETTVNTTIPVSHVRSRALAIRNVYNGRVSVSTQLVIQSSYESPEYAGTMSASIPVQVRQRTYSIGNGKATTTKTHTEVLTTTEPVPFKHAGPAFLVALLLLLTSGSAYQLSRIADATRTQWNYDLLQFEEWISRGRVTLGEVTQVVEEESVPDLVDMAIDSGNRVVYDTEKQACIVIDDTTIHYVAHPASDWSPEAVRADETATQ